MRSSPPTLRDRPCRPCVSQPSLLVPTLTSLRHDTQKATAGPQMPTTVCFNWFIQSPVIGIWQKGWRHPESSAKGPDDGTALSTQRPPRGKPASLGQCGSVGPLGSWLPRLGLCSGVDKWGAGGRIATTNPLQRPRALVKGMPRCQRDGGPRPLMVLP